MAFNPSRLNVARKRRGMSKAALAKAINSGLRILGYYETGEKAPSEETIQALSKVLQFPPDFFYGNDIEEIAVDSASFRSLSTMTASLRDASLASGALSVELAKWIETRFDLPKPNIPTLRQTDPETAAEILRTEWGIGQRPIKNAIHLAELNGVRVFSLPIDSASVDAFSVWHNETPFVFLNPMKSGERGRMDVFHEIGHLCMHGHGIPRSRQAELEADRFASALLMPAQDVLANIPGAFSLKVIHKLKKRWKVSASSLVVRLRALNVISEWQYRTLFIELSESGQRTNELDGIPRESSQIIGKVFDALRSDGVTRNSIARDLNITPSELNSLIAGLTLSVVAPTSEVIQSEDNEPQERPLFRLV